MPPGEALTCAADLSEEEVAQSLRPAPEARYLFADDSGSFAGVYVAGPLTGTVLILDHDDPERTPLFRDLPSFLDRLVESHEGVSGPAPAYRSKDDKIFDVFDDMRTAL